MQEFDIDEMVDNEVFAAPAEPVADMLPRRNQPYVNTPQQSPAFNNPFANIWGSQSQQTASFTDDELKQMASLETDYILNNISMYMGLGKGILSAIIFDKEDKRIYNQEVLTGKIQGKEAIEIMEYKSLAERLDSKAFNAAEKRDFMYKVVFADMQRKRTAGTLKMHDTSYYIKQIISSEFQGIIGSDPKIISAIGAKIMRKFRR